jgi:MFS transporter, DHA3 family, macrolide efflux protein
MKKFVMVWLGQLTSVLGTNMARLALTIWAFQETGQATALALVSFFSFIPNLIFTPIAGALSDRWNRKVTMMLSDLAAAGVNLIVLLVFLAGDLEIWHLYLAAAAVGIFESFQFPAYSAAVSVMLPKEQYTRGNAMLSLVNRASNIAAPVLAGLLIALIGIGGVLIVDIMTSIFALLMLAITRIPQPPEAPGKVNSSIWRDSAFGFTYIFSRPGLLGVQLAFTALNLVTTVTLVLTAPLILARTQSHAMSLATVQSFLGAGGLVSALLLSVWGGPSRKIRSVLVSIALVGLLGISSMGLGRTLIIWSFAAFWTTFFFAFADAANQSIWQAKVPQHMQGRVFSARRFIAQITAPIAMQLAGPLADRVMEPAMMEGGTLAPIFGGLVGTGPGAGIGLIFFMAGILTTGIGVSSYAFTAIREVETSVSDHDPNIDSKSS